MDNLERVAYVVHNNGGDVLKPWTISLWEKKGGVWYIKDELLEGTGFYSSKEEALAVAQSKKKIASYTCQVNIEIDIEEDDDSWEEQ